jgi:hypothetical protein
MSFEIGTSVNNIADRFLSVPLVKTVAESPIFTSGIIAVIMIIVIMLVYGVADSVRLGFWTFVLSTIVIFLHDRVLLKEYEEKQIAREAKEIFSPPLLPVTGAVPVEPRPVVEGVPMPAGVVPQQTP